MSHDSNAEAKFVQDGRSGEHLRNVKEGYLTDGHNQVHHIVCHSCVQDAAIYVAEVDKEYVRKCLAVTDWNVNAEKNLIGLPLKSAYIDVAGGKYGEHALWDKLPCHQVDHNPHYTTKVKKHLHDTVWNTLKGKVNDCELVPEKSVAGMLDAATEHFKTFLRDRGKEHDGTKICWDERHGTKADVWYIPFSMHPGEIPKRKAPPASFNATTALNSLASSIFQRVK